MKALAFGIFTALLPLAARSRDLPPQYWIENIEAADHSIQQCIVFGTVKGVLYTLEKSDDLSTWSPEEAFGTEGEIYGISHECVFAIREFMPPPTGGTPPTSELKTNVSLKLQPSSAGGTIAMWPSLSGSGSVIVILTHEMDDDWATIPLFCDTYGDYRMFVWHPPGAVAPPTPSASLGPEDSDFLAVLNQSFAAMNQQVDTNQATARNTPLPATSDPAAKHFWRIKANWNLDSDVDGSPDWAEFEMQEDPEHPFHSLADPFNRDVDNNGIADGAQLDNDGDGTTDNTDTAPADPVWNLPKSVLPRYAVFPITGAQPPPQRRAPIQISDRGRVLYVNGTWSKGQWQPLATTGGELTDCLASSINDEDEIVGHGTYVIQAEPRAVGAVIAYWPAAGANPTPVTQGDNFAMSYTEIIVGNPPGPFISNNGEVIAPQATISPSSEPGSLPFFEYSPEGGRLKWTIPRTDPPREEDTTPVDAGMSFISSGGYYWGIDPASGDISVPLLGQPGNLSQMPTNIVPGNQAIYAFSEGVTRAFTGGVWKTSLRIPNGVDMSFSGAVASRDVSKPLFLNGEPNGINRFAPQTPPRWQAPKLLDMSGGGWILAWSGGGSEPDYSAMLPLTLEGNLDRDGDGTIVRDAVGVDNYSIICETPGEAVKNAIWIMAPLGAGETRVRLQAPLHTSAPLTIKGTGLKFNDQDTLTLDTPSSEFTLKAAEGTANGQEVFLEIKSGGLLSQSKPIAVKVMKRRVVKVTVFKTQASSGTPPAYNPDVSDIQTYLNRTFGPQVNVHFECTGETIVQPGFDVSNGTDFGKADGLTPNNQNLDVNEDGYGNEVLTLKSVAYDNEKSINIYLMGEIKNINSWKLNPGGTELVSGLGYRTQNGQQVPKSAAGIVNRELRMIFIPAGDATTSPAEGLDTIGHEVGHMLFDIGHPDKGGHAPLKGIDPLIQLQRLMAPGSDLKPRDGSSRVTVKEEWDEAKKWLDEEVDALRIDP